MGDDTLLHQLREALPGPPTATSARLFRSAERERPQPAPGLTPGRRVGDFKLVALIGQGGMGQVWEAEQVSLQRRVAVKFVRPERVTERQLELFAREARAGGRLSHPGIVTVYGHGHSDGLAWIAMEYVEGAWTLRDFLDQTTRAEEVPEGYDRQVAQLVAEIADAMQAAHEAGVIHRDLKPQNVLITSLDRPKVTDFGLARITDETALSQTGEFAGTYFYMSPEQVAARRAGIDSRTDVFSLGIVLYELLALRRPFEGDTTHQVAAQILAKDPPDVRTTRSRVPRDLAVIAGKALEKDRDRRFQTMAELAADLRRHLANEPILARPPSRPERLVKWIQRNPTKSVALAVASVTFAVIAYQYAEIRRTNEALLAKTREAQRAAESERHAAEEARRRTDEVLRLSASEDVEDLVEQADRLWPIRTEDIPAYRSWLDAAGRQLRALPEHEARLAALRAGGRAPTSEELAYSRASSGRQRRLAVLEGELRYRTTLLAALDGGSAGGPVGDPQGSILELSAQAWSRVHPLRVRFGSEGEGLACALAALKGADEEDTVERARLRMLVAWGWFGVGDFEAATAEAEQAAEEGGRDGNGLEADLKLLHGQLEDLLSPQGQEAERARIADLEAIHARVEADVASINPEVVLDDAGDRWWLAQTTLLVDKLHSLADQTTGLVSGASGEHGWGVERRLHRAQALAEQSIEGPSARALWAEAIASIADEQVCPAYAGLRLRPRLGLLPLGRDPDSGLWEFAHLLSGDLAARNASGHLEILESTGLVLVLVPGGSFLMGAQSNSRGGLHYDPTAGSDEAPVHEVTVAPFFLSKFEMTQGQWQRMSGTNPSTYGAAFRCDLRHPVEDVSWNECARMVRWLGLTLPTEAQWEYCARAGTESVWFTGDERESLSGAVNLLDLYCKRNGGPTDGCYEEWLDDGASFHAPVGSYRANRFGLHDVHGNVCEWCLEEYTESYSKAPLLGSGERVSSAATSFRMHRGGGFTSRAVATRSALRTFVSPNTRAFFLGLRPALGLED